MSEKELTLYELLGFSVGIVVRENSTQDELTKHYFRIKNEIEKSMLRKGEMAETLYVLDRLWSVLGDPLKRREYDMRLGVERKFCGRASEIRVAGKAIITGVKKGGVYAEGTVNAD